ncbi:hypothetical protein [Kitasatospora sp. NPDC057223]|uniref:hypothetical protein n=1 Tax=Kitasatospora sp. NPDC057223 TaxID=3346055 RepID=UPI00363FC56D
MFRFRLSSQQDAQPARAAGRAGLRNALLAALFLGIALSGVIALLALGYEVEALVTVIVTAAVEASAAFGWRPAVSVDTTVAEPAERTR